MNQDDFTEVLGLLNNYVDGLYRLDIEILRDVFSPSAQYATITDGALLSHLCPRMRISQDDQHRK